MTDTGPAKLPGLPTLTSSDPALQRWAQAVAEHLEVRAGARGNPAERSVTQRELAALSSKLSYLGTAKTQSAGGIVLDFGGGLSASLSYTQFADAIRNTKLFKDMMLKLDDQSRFDSYPDEIRKLLLNSLTEEARIRGASISALESATQSATSSLAYRMDQITASVGSVAAGVREVTFASATANEAQAGKVTQLVAALDGTGSATIEESLQVISNRTDGLRAQSMLKLNAGGAVAGIGLMASEDPAGNTESVVLIQADKFALVGTEMVVQDPANPPLNLIPFGYDGATDTLFLSGQVRINAGGPTLAEAGKRGAVTGFGAMYGISPSGWSDSHANRVIYNMITGQSSSAALGSVDHLEIGDTVTLSNGSDFAAVRYWSGSGWLTPGVVLDGNMLVNGTVSASKITAGAITTSGGNALINIGSTTFVGGISSPFHASKTNANPNQALITALNSKDASTPIWGASAFPSGSGVSGTWHSSPANAANGNWQMIGLLGSSYMGAAVAGSTYGTLEAGAFRYYDGTSDKNPGSITKQARLASRDWAIEATGPVRLESTISPLIVNGSSGSAGQVLTSAGAGATPVWTTISAAGPTPTPISGMKVDGGSGAGGVAVTFSTAFSAAPGVSVVSIDGYVAGISSISASGFTAITRSLSGAVSRQVFRWVAVGN